ncbi:hypothetical protein PVV53_24980, partial [Salmonella enterica subsp. enterica serovar London]
HVAGQMHLLDQAVAAAQDDGRGDPAPDVEMESVGRLAFALENLTTPPDHLAIAQFSQRPRLAGRQCRECLISMNRIRYFGLPRPWSSYGP